MNTPPDLMTLEPSPPSPSSESPPTSSTEAPAHLEAALAAAEGAPIGASPAAPKFMPRDEWCKLYVGCHGIAGNFMGSKVLEGVPQRAGGLEAAGAMYDTCVDVPAMHFLIAPGGVWFQRAGTMLLFYAPLVGELRAERAARVQAPREPAPRDPAGPLGNAALGIPAGA